jgi:lipopolysaccharide transport system ATP-binding protein
MKPIITVENLAKKYTLRHKPREHYSALRDVITSSVSAWTRRMFNTGRTPTLEQATNEEFWALNNISFQINEGDRIGIIGRNGAGKSTLLKIMSRITEPTKGCVKIRGRVASLLEVGTGFHPELTGRENIFLNGAILGMSRAEIRQKFDEIVDFAEIEKFLDTPVKRYSSGMYVRLAFAVAAHLDPEILIVDEVLAVGDAQFQKKCLGKMEDVSRQEGRTILFVSHNMEALLNLCTTGLMLQDGEMVHLGEAKEAVRRYLMHSKQTIHQEWQQNETAPGNDQARLLKASVKSFDDDAGIFSTNAPFEFEFVFFNNAPGETSLDVTYHLIDERGILVYVGSTIFNNINKKFKRGVVQATCTVPSNLLNEGTYTVSRLLLVKNRGTVVYEHRDVLIFDVMNPGTGQLGWAGHKEGVVKPALQWQIAGQDSLSI